MDKKLKRIEDEVIGLVIELVGTVWGIEMARGSWTDDEMKRFNNKATAIQDRALTKIEKIYRRRVKGASPN